MNPWTIIGWLILLTILVVGGGYLLLVAIDEVLTHRSERRAKGHKPMSRDDKLWLWFFIILGLCWLFTR